MPQVPHKDEGRRRALETLEGLRENASFAGSALGEAGRRAVRHFAGRDADPHRAADDAIELWGRRIGRMLSLIGCIALGLYLYLTYLR